MIVKKVGKITLAITLIGAGLVLIAEKFLTIPFRELFKLWPLLLIALGLEMILSVVFFGRRKDVILRFDRIALMAAIIFSLVASGVSNTFGLTDLSPQVMFDGMKFKHQKTENFVKENISAGETVTKLVVDSSFGDMELVPSTDKSIKIEAQATLHFNEKDAATNGLEKLFTISEGATTTIKVNSPENFAKNALTRTKLVLTVYVPEGVTLQASNTFGKTSANGLNGTINLVNKHGALEVEKITGTLSAENSFGSIQVRNISGGTKVINRNGSIDISDITGSLSSDNNFGSTEIDNVSGNATVSSSNGAIRVMNVKGNLTSQNSFGKVDASDIGGDTQITNANGATEVSDANGNIAIKSSFGSVLCETPNIENAQISLRTSFGSIQPVNGTNPIEKTSSANLVKTFGSGTYTINIENSNGDIILK